MKTLILKIELPDGYSIINIAAFTGNFTDDIINPEFTEIHLPTDEDIEKSPLKENYVTVIGSSFHAGAKWLRDQILKP